MIAILKIMQRDLLSSRKEVLPYTEDSNGIK